MSSPLSLSRFAGRPLVATLLRSALASASLPPLAASAQAFTDAADAAATERLDAFVIVGTRTPTTPFALGTAVDQISAVDLARRQLRSLADALGSVPGAPVFPSGAMGASASLFLRGANSNQTLFLLDGIRANDPNTDYQLLLGGACVSACDSLEIAHGPQSTLYGGEAVGGVVALRSQRGTGDGSGRVALEAGSFGTIQGAVSAQGASDAWAYSFAAQGGHTDNDRPHNAFDSANVTLRLDRDLREGLTVGATVRGFQGIYESPGDRFTNDPDNEERESNWLVTTFVEAQLAPDWSARATLGGQARRFLSENPGPFGLAITEVTNRRAVLDAQTTWSGLATHRVTAGLTGETNATRNTGFGAIDESQTLLAFFAQDEWSPRDDLHFTAGVRSDDHDTFGHATTWRGTVAWLPLPERLKVRASYGTAFRSPSFLDLYGESAFYVGNPDLDPESARGWDAGLDYYLPDARGTLSLTWFETRYRDLIIFDFGVFPGTTANVDRARTRGLELGGKTRVTSTVELRAAYTYLEAENTSTDTRLLRRPRHSFNGDVVVDLPRDVTVGAGLVFMLDREDVHADTFATIDAEDFTVVRLFASWAATERLTLKARVENLLDEAYETVHGFPQPGVGGFASVEWSW